jgi:ABC-type Fe3+-siderophore transport system permease subunit
VTGPGRRSALDLAAGSAVDDEVAPHAARALVGRRHARVVPVALLLGAVLVCTADLLGRTVIAPAQLGAGVVIAVLGTPCFLHLLIRARR